MGGEPEYFSKEDIQMADRYMKRCSISLIIREMQIRAKTRCITSHLTAIVKKEKQVLARMWRKWGPHALLLGI